MKKISEKKLAKIDFDFHFGVQKPYQIAPKSTWDAKKQGLERSLFRDAMQIAKKPSKFNGPRSFATVSLVFQRIRSALSVSLSLC